MTAGRTKAGAALLVALTLVLAACTDGGSERGGGATARSTSTAAPAPRAPEPGDRFDGEDLPAPVSNLAVLDDLLLYYAPDEQAHLELVAVDPEAGAVAWTHPAAVPSIGEGQVIELEATGDGDGVVVLARSSGDDETAFEVQAVDLDGTTRWAVPIETPLTFPSPCGDRVCVSTSAGPVAADLRTGDHETGPALTGRTVAESDDWVLSRESHPAKRGGDQIVARRRFESEPAWHRPSAELFGDPNPWGAGGSQYGDVWVIEMSPEAPFEVEAYPHRFPPSTTAGFAVADGSPRWRRQIGGPCLVPSADDLLVTCDMDYTQASEDADIESRLVGVAALDPATGADRVRVTTLPYDSSEGDRLATVAPDVLAVRTPTGIQEVDLRAGTAKPTTAGRVAWCRPDGHLPVVRDVEDHEVAFSTGEQARPCTVDGAEATEEELLAPVIDGSLPAVPGVSAVSIGPWVLWADDGQLVGVATQR